MIDHVSIPVADVERAARFYDAVLLAVGLRRGKERPGAIGYGPESRAAPVFWILQREGDGSASGIRSARVLRGSRPLQRGCLSRDGSPLGRARRGQARPEAA